MSVFNICIIEFYIKEIPLSSSTINLCVLYGSQNEQRLFLYIALNVGLFITERIVCTMRYERDH